MRRVIFWSAWVVLFLVPIVYVTNCFWVGDLLKFPLWAVAVMILAVCTIYVARNKGNVLEMHLPH